MESIRCRCKSLDETYLADDAKGTILCSWCSLPVRGLSEYDSISSNEWNSTLTWHQRMIDLHNEHSSVNFYDVKMKLALDFNNDNPAIEDGWIKATKAFEASKPKDFPTTGKILVFGTAGEIPEYGADFYRKLWEETMTDDYDDWDDLPLDRIEGIYKKREK